MRNDGSRPAASRPGLAGVSSGSTDQRTGIEIRKFPEQEYLGDVSPNEGEFS